MKSSQKSAIKEIKAFILPRGNKLHKIFIISTLVMLGLIAMIFSKFDPMTEKTAVKFDGENSAYGEYVYVDIQSMGDKSDGLFKESYFLAIDTDGEQCLLKIKDSDLQDGKFSVATGRLYGEVDTLFDVEREYIDPPITGYDSENCVAVGKRELFGRNFPVFIFSLFTVILWLVFLIPYRRIYGAARYCLRTLKKNNLIEQAEKEMKAPGSLCFTGGNGIATEHFVFSPGLATVLRYEDIVRVYPVLHKKGGSTLFGFVCADTRKRRSLYISALRPENILQHAQEIMAVVQRNNPSVIIGAVKTAPGRLPKRLRK